MKEKIWRLSLNEYIYTSAVSGIISYFVGYVFIEEDKIKKIFRRNKEGDMKLKYELAIIVQEIGKKFNTIIPKMKYNDNEGLDITPIGNTKGYQFRNEDKNKWISKGGFQVY